MPRDGRKSSRRGAYQIRGSSACRRHLGGSNEAGSAPVGRRIVDLGTDHRVDRVIAHRRQGSRATACSASNGSRRLRFSMIPRYFASLARSSSSGLRSVNVDHAPTSPWGLPSASRYGASGTARAAARRGVQVSHRTQTHPSPITESRCHSTAGPGRQARFEGSLTDDLGFGRPRNSSKARYTRMMLRIL